MDQPAPTQRTRDTIMRLIGFAIGVVFLSAGSSKALAPEELALILLHVMPVAGLGAAGMTLLVTIICTWEAFLGAFLIFSPTSRIALTATVGTLFVFTGFLLALLLQPDAPPCGCGELTSALGPVLGGPTVAIGRNAVLIIASMWVVTSGRR